MTTDWPKHGTHHGSSACFEIILTQKNNNTSWSVYKALKRTDLNSAFWGFSATVGRLLRLESKILTN